MGIIPTCDVRSTATRFSSPTKTLLGYYVWLPGRIRIEERRNEGPQPLMKAKKTETEQNRRNARGRQHDVARRIQMRATFG